MIELCSSRATRHLLAAYRRCQFLLRRVSVLLAVPQVCIAHHRRRPFLLVSANIHPQEVRFAQCLSLNLPAGASASVSTTIRLRGRRRSSGSARKLRRPDPYCRRRCAMSTTDMRTIGRPTNELSSFSLPPKKEAAPRGATSASPFEEVRRRNGRRN